jgi:hypothetical protein
LGWHRILAVACAAAAAVSLWLFPLAGPGWQMVLALADGAGLRLLAAQLGKLRIHGSGDLLHWFNYDPTRPSKSRAIVLHVHGRIRPVVTPDDPDRVADELRAHGVNVTEGRESGLR